MQYLTTLQWNAIVQPARQISLTACAKILNLSLPTGRTNIRLGWLLIHIFPDERNQEPRQYHGNNSSLDPVYLFL